MRIAFDLDDTLIPGRYHFPTECPFPCSLLRIFFPEKLRKGTQVLLQELHKRGHDVWLYTTSQRPSWYLKLWFWILGISLDGVVNLARHRQTIGAYSSPVCYASKYPPAFAIDVLVDDSEGVVLEGQQYGFSVIRIAPDDITWTETLRNALDSITANTVFNIIERK